MSGLLFTGFNGFEQFGNRDNDVGLKVSNFKPVAVAVSTKLFGEFIIAPSWRYTAFAQNKCLWLRGLLGAKAGADLHIEAKEIIVSLAACDRFCLALLANGELYKLLPQSDVCLEQVKLELPPQQQQSQRKRNIFGDFREGLDEVNAPIVTHIACGNNITVAISNSNTVYNLPSIIHQFPRHLRVKELYCGFEHALMLSENGDIYAWGNGLRGQLGQLVLQQEEEPILVEALAGLKIVRIAASGWHSVALSSFGDIYTWGFNKNGQLGLPLFKSVATGPIKEPSVYPIPQCLDLPRCCANKECTVKCIAAGSRHTVILMSCGQLLATGWNAYGQLSLPATKSYCDQFEKVEAPSLKKVSRIICGPWCTILKI